MKKKNKITPQERDLIAVWQSQKVSFREIGKRLDRSHTSISREIKRNSFKGKYYVSIYAQAKYKKRKSKAGERHSLKNPCIYSYVLEKLRLWVGPRNKSVAGYGWNKDVELSAMNVFMILSTNRKINISVSGNTYPGNRRGERSMEERPKGSEYLTVFLSTLGIKQ